MLPCWVALSLNFIDVSLRLTLDSFLVTQNCQQKPSDVLFKSALLRKFILITVCIKELIRLNHVTSCKLQIWKYHANCTFISTVCMSYICGLLSPASHWVCQPFLLIFVLWIHSIFGSGGNFQSLPKIPDGIIWVLYSPLHSLFDT